MLPNFWNDNEHATEVQQEISEIKNEISALEEIKTSYSPDRPELVYCESCYQNEVA